MRSWEVKAAWTAAAALGWATLAPTAALAQPAALDQVPQGADLVIVVPNLQQFSGEIADFRQSLNLPMPELDDVLGLFKQSTGMNAGVEDAGALLIVLSDLPEALQEDREPQTLMLVPVSDYNAFVQNYGGTADATSAITMPGGEPGFVRKLGDYAVMGETQEAVDAYQPGQAAAAITAKAGALGRQYLDDADALLYLDMEAVAPALLPALRESITSMTQSFDDMAAGGVDPQTIESSKAMWRMYGVVGEAILNDATGLVAALDLTPGGLGLTYALSYREGSSLAQALPGGQAGGAVAPMLAALPSKPFIFSAAFDATAIDLVRLYETAIGQLPEGENSMRQMSERALPMLKELKAGAMAFYAPEMAMMGNFLNTVTVLEVENAPNYVQLVKDYVQGLNGFQVPAGIPADPAAAPADPAAPAAPQPMIGYTTSYTDNVLQLEGQQVDQFQMTTNFPQEMLEQMGPAAGFANMFANYSGYVTGKDGTVILTTVLDPQVVSNTLQQVDNGGGIGAAGALARIRDTALPPEPVAQMYLGVDGLANTANTFLQMFGAQPLPVPQDLPPIASGLSIQDHSLAYRVYFPTEAVRYVIEAGTMLQQQFGGMGGEPNRGPGGPPPF